jgi:hypothetical protein
MKTISHLLITISFALLLAGCKPSHRVTFSPANVSIDPGDGWKVLITAANPPVCSPRLVRSEGMINALLMEEETDPREAANKLQARFSQNAKAVPDSFKQEDFTSDSGLTGVHLSYTGGTADSLIPDTRSHNFITKNMLGKCVSISYITSVSNESPAVIEAIRKTVRVE